MAGPLVVIGGAEDKKGSCDILTEFLRLAGGSRARVLVMTVASEFPAETGAAYLETFLRLGAKEVEVMDVRQRDEACRPDLTSAIEEATAVFFTGGDQRRVTNLLGGSPADRALHPGTRRGCRWAAPAPGRR